MLSEPKVNVLLVDDHPENLLALEAILDSLGQNLVKATSGGQALRCLLNQDFAVILLDVQMPDMDGFETAELIRQRERSRHTPIIFLTAFSTSDNMVFKGYSLGAVDYLFKPIEPEILKSKVAAFVDLFQKTAEVKRQAAQLQAMNAELKKREEMFRSLSACSPVGIFLTDETGKCTYTNPRYQSIYGITLEESLGEGWAQKIHPEDREKAIANWYSASSAGQEYKGEFRILTSDLVERWVDVRSSPMLSDKGEVIGYVGTLGDITEGKQAQEEHIQLICEQTARQEAETANKLKDEFLATLSHELRTPLSSILGWAKLLRQRKFDEKTISRGLETIQRNASLQAQLINDILDVSQIIRGKLNLTFCPVNLLSAITAAMDTVRLEAEAKSIDFRFSILDFGLGEELEHGESNIDFHQERDNLNNLKSKIQNPKLYVFGDANRLQQIMWNLLSNAIKFTPAGGRVEVLISIASVCKDKEKFQPHQMLGTSEVNGKHREAPELETAAIPNSSVTKCTCDGDFGGNYVQIEVSDTGIGISPDFLPHVFDRFRQADGSITRNHGGLGLGLAIVRHLVEMHKGSVHAESSGVGQGAKFTVKLPLLDQDKPLFTGEVGTYHASSLQG
jgi:PAS domain S-box-containing protein